MKTKIIIDSDIANEMDDLFAIAYAVKSKQFDIAAITIAPYHHKNFDVTNSQAESLKIGNELAEQLHIDKSLLKIGSSDYMDNGYAENSPAVDCIIALARKHRKVTIMALGTITNIALAVQKAPDIIPFIKVIFLGGHSKLLNDNSEYNFRKDLTSNRIVFYSGVDLTVIPCKLVASNLRTSIFELQHKLDNTNPLHELLIDRFCTDGTHPYSECRIIWDIAVVAYLIEPKWFTVHSEHCPKINDDLTYSTEYLNHKINFVDYIDANKVYKNMFKCLNN